MDRNRGRAQFDGGSNGGGLVVGAIRAVRRTWMRWAAVVVLAAGFLFSLTPTAPATGISGSLFMAFWFVASAVYATITTIRLAYFLASGRTDVGGGDRYQ